MNLSKRVIPAVLVVSLLAMFLSFLHADAGNGIVTVKDELLAGLEPIGKCLYVYGGGWNEEDTGAGKETMTTGLSPQWEKFYNAQDADYDFNTTRYQIHDGLDCTGYVGWVMYQLFGDRYSDSGYVFPSSRVAKNYSALFGSTIIPRSEVENRKSGDIMATEGHVYIVVGQCDDGSVVLMHASVPSVSLAGTADKNGNADSQAARLAKQYMEKYFPEEAAKYHNYLRDNPNYLQNYDEIVWDESVLSDPDHYRDMSAEEILKDLFENPSAAGQKQDATPFLTQLQHCWSAIAQKFFS